MASLARRALIGGMLSFTVGVVMSGSSASAHEDRSTSEPPSGSVVTDSISELTIDFGVPVDDPELGLLPPGEETAIAGTTTTQLSDSTAKIEFDAVEHQGTYIVQYLTTATQDKHLLVGAVSFRYDPESGGGGSGAMWLLLAIVPVTAVAGGFAAWSRGRRRGESEIDEDLSDVGV